MGLIDQIRQDAKKYTSDLPGWAVEITLASPLGATATINGLHSKHHLGLDTDGNRVNVKNAHISFHESVAIAAGYPIRNSNNEVSLRNHRVRVKDSTGVDCLYIINEWFPSETTGIIVCILGDFE